MAEWPRLTVQALQDSSLLLVEDGNHGEYRPRREEFSAVGTAFIRATDMAHGQILFDTASKISESALRRIRKGIGQPWDVLLSHKGTVGKVARTGGSCPPFVCSPQTTFYRSLRHEVIDPRFLFYDLQSPSFQRQLFSRKGETDMADYVSLTEQRRLVIDVPPIVEQQAIAEVLGALDDKIEPNRTKVSLSYEVLRRTWQLTAKETAETVAVGDIAALDKGLSYKGAGLGSGAPFVNLGNFGVDGLFHADALKRYSGESRERHWVQDGDLVLANTDLTQRCPFRGGADLRGLSDTPARGVLDLCRPMTMISCYVRCARGVAG